MSRPFLATATLGLLSGRLPTSTEIVVAMLALDNQPEERMLHNFRDLLSQESAVTTFLIEVPTTNIFNYGSALTELRKIDFETTNGVEKFLSTVFQHLLSTIWKNGHWQPFEAAARSSGLNISFRPDKNGFIYAVQAKNLNIATEPLSSELITLASRTLSRVDHRPGRTGSEAPSTTLLSTLFSAIFRTIFEQHGAELLQKVAQRLLQVAAS